MQLCLQHLHGGQLHQVLRHPDLAPLQLPQLDMLPVLLAAEDEPNGRLLSWPTLLFIQPSQVQLHLALIGDIEAAQLQFNGHHVAQAAVLCHFTYVYP